MATGIDEQPKFIDSSYRPRIHWGVMVSPEKWCPCGEGELFFQCCNVRQIPCWGLPGDSACPCESGKMYEECCLKKGVQYHDEYHYPRIGDGLKVSQDEEWAWLEKQFKKYKPTPTAKYGIEFKLSTMKKYGIALVRSINDALIDGSDDTYL